MYVEMCKMYGKDHEKTQQFAQLMKNPDVKNRHLEIIFQCHEKEFQKQLQKERKGAIKMTRTIAEIRERINWLEDRIFYLNMKDYWTFDDKRTITQWENEVFNLKQELKKREV